MRKCLAVFAAAAGLAAPGCAPQPGQPDLLSMAREMSGEFGTFTVDMKDEVVDRVLDETGGLTGYDEREARAAARKQQGWMVP